MLSSRIDKSFEVGLVQRLEFNNAPPKKREKGKKVSVYCTHFPQEKKKNKRNTYIPMHYIIKMDVYKVLHVW